MSNFATWLQAAIDARGWDQRQAALELGVPETSVHNWLHQGIRPGVKNVLKIAKGLKEPVETVLRQAGYNPKNHRADAPDDVTRQRAEVLAALPQFSEIIDLLARQPPERQAAYIEVIRRLMSDPGLGPLASSQESSQ